MYLTLSKPFYSFFFSEFGQEDVRRDVGLGVLDHEACMEASKSITSHKKSLIKNGLRKRDMKLENTDQSMGTQMP